MSFCVIAWQKMKIRIYVTDCLCHKYFLITIFELIILHNDMLLLTQWTRCCDASRLKYKWKYTSYTYTSQISYIGLGKTGQIYKKKTTGNMRLQNNVCNDSTAAQLAIYVLTKREMYTHGKERIRCKKYAEIKGK